MKKNIVALFLIATMVVSVCAVAGVTTSTKADAATTTKTTIKVPRAAYVGRTITITGTVTTSSGASVGTLGQVALYKRFSGVMGGLQYWKTVPVVMGTFRATDQGVYGSSMNTYQARYLGTHWVWGAWQYLPSTSAQASVVFKYQSALSIDATSFTPGNNVYGTLRYWKPSAWNPLANKYVYVYKRNAETKGWALSARLKTDAHGRWQTADLTSLRTQYYAKCYGDSEFAGSTSRMVGPL